MKVRLRNEQGDVVNVLELPDDAVPTPTVFIDGATDIIYKLEQSGNYYDCYPVNYWVLGTKSQAMVDRNGKMYWSKRTD